MPSEIQGLFEEAAEFAREAGEAVGKEMNLMFNPEKSAKQIRQAVQALGLEEFTEKAVAGGHQFNETAPCAFCQDIVKSELLK